MNNVISVIIKRKNEYKRTGKTASSERDERCYKTGGERPTTGKEKDKPIRPKNKEQKCAREKERVAEVEDRSRKDTKTEKNGETPRERGVNWREG